MSLLTVAFLLVPFGNLIVLKALANALATGLGAMADVDELPPRVDTEFCKSVRTGSELGMELNAVKIPLRVDGVVTAPLAGKFAGLEGEVFVLLLFELLLLEVPPVLPPVLHPMNTAAMSARTTNNCFITPPFKQ
jgi:hypothetical protein